MTSQRRSSFALSRRALIIGAAASLVATPALADATDDPFVLPPFDEKKLPKPFRRAIVAYNGRHWPGTIIVDTQERQLYLVLDNKKAIRYGCAVGRDGFRWAGLADVGRKVMWPRWTPLSTAGAGPAAESTPKANCKPFVGSDRGSASSGSSIATN